MKALVGAFNQEKALVGAFSVILKTGCGTDGSSAALVLILETETDHLKNEPELSRAEHCSRSHIYISFLLAMSTAPGIGRSEQCSDTS